MLALFNFGIRRLNLLSPSNGVQMRQAHPPDNRLDGRILISQSRPADNMRWIEEKHVFPLETMQMHASLHD